ncbi:MAG: hypothetical protein AB7G93_16420 [Bdellovibrionales bacterium]
MNSVLDSRGPTESGGAQIVIKGGGIVAEILGHIPDYRAGAVKLPKTWPNDDQKALTAKALEMLGLKQTVQDRVVDAWLEAMRGGEDCDDCILLDDGEPITVTFGPDAEKLRNRIACTNRMRGKEWLFVVVAGLA